MCSFAERAARRWVLLAAALGLAACGGVVDAERTPVASVTLSQASVSVEVGATQQLTATAHDAEGNTLTDRQIFWSSSDTLVVRVSPTGLVTGVAPGSAQIAASAERQSGLASVAVVPPAVDRVAVAPPNPTLPVRQTLPLSATLTSARGGVLTGRPIGWESSNPEIATVDGAGVVTGLRPGSATITASAEGVRGTASVSITPGSPTRLLIHFGNEQTGPTGAPLADPLAVRVTDADGFAVPGVAVSWSAPAGSGSLQPTSSLTDADGVARAQWTLGSSPGNHTAIAAIEGVASVTFTARARPGRVSTITVTPASTTLTALAATAGFTATAFDALGNPLPGESFAWSSSNPAVAAITTGGVATALSNGDTEIVARAEGVSGTATLVVAQRVARVLVNPTSATLALGDTLRLTASVTDANGYPVAEPVSWASSNSTLASVSPTGLVRGLATGSVTITATSGGVVGSANVTVQNSSVATLAIHAGDQQTGVVGSPLPDSLAVRVADVQGNPVPGVTVTWATAAGSGSITPLSATTNSNGIARARWVLGPLAGDHSATASVVGLTPVTFTARARPGPVASVTVTPASATLNALASSVTYTAGAFDAYGNPVPGQSFSWSSSAPQVASVSASGEATALANGQSTITARTGQVTGNASLTVAQQVATVAVTPASSIVAIADTVRLAAVARDANGHPVVGASFSWSSSAPSVASVNGNGRVRGEALGTATITAASGGRSGTASVNVVSGPPATVVAVAGSGQTGFVGQPLPDLLVARVTDAAGNPVAGVTVSWTTSGNGTFNPASTTTGADGRASTRWTLGTTEGTQTAQARVVSLPPASFTATARAGAAAMLSIVSGNGQSGRSGDPLPVPLVVRVTDSYGNAVPGTTITWTLQHNGSVVPPASETSAQGTASAIWTLGPGSPTQQLEAAVAGLPPVVFTAQRLTGRDEI